MSGPGRDSSGQASFDSAPLPGEPDQSVAAALMAAGVLSWRTTRRGGRPRGLFCGIGVCHDCLVTVDGAPDQRACLVPWRPGMVVESGDGHG